MGPVLHKNEGGCMADSERIYRRTSAGHGALRAADPGIPEEHLRVLAAIDNSGTHAAILVGALKDYSEGVVRGWLSRLEALGLVESVEVVDQDDLDFTGNFQLVSIRAELERRRREENERIDSLLLR
jgi:hypothetical protein